MFCFPEWSEVMGLGSQSALQWQLSNVPTDVVRQQRSAGPENSYLQRAAKQTGAEEAAAAGGGPGWRDATEHESICSDEHTSTPY